MEKVNSYKEIRHLYTNPAFQTPYVDQLRLKEWRELRETVLDRDKNTCTECGRKQSPRYRGIYYGVFSDSYEYIFNGSYLVVMAFCFASVVSSCTSKKYIHYNNDPTVIEISDSTIKQNKISSVIETVIKYGKGQYEGTTHIERQLFFDMEGRVKCQVKPKYLQTLTKIPKWETGNWGEFLGYHDSTFYEYDSRGFLNSEKRINYGSPTFRIEETLSYSYDNLGSKTSYCHSSPTTPIWCFYYSYAYDSKNKILARTDSIDFDSPVKFAGTFQYRYDKRGRLVYDGYYVYMFDAANRIVEKIPQPPNSEVDFGYRYFYDKNGYIAKVETNWKGTEPLHIDQYKYDENGLLIEKKYIEDGEVKKLFKYEYIKSN